MLEAPRDMLIQKADLEEETVDDVLRILQEEFDETEGVEDAEKTDTENKEA